MAGFFYASFAFASEITPENVIRLVNQERIKENLTPLSENSILSKAAKNKAADMIENNYFAHTSPKGISPWFWLEKEGYEYVYAGENLAINFKTAEKQNETLMKSPTHKKNILSPNFNEIGVAVAIRNIDGKKSTLVVQTFGYMNDLPVVFGKTSESLSKEVPISNNISEIVAEKSVGNKTGYISSIVSIIRSADYLRLMKFFAAISSFIVMTLFFSSIVHKISKIGSIVSNIERKFFKYFENMKIARSSKNRNVIKSFSMDIRKIEITHLDHMKQRE